MCIQSHNFYFYLWQARPLDPFAENAGSSKVSRAWAFAFARSLARVRRSHRRSTLPHTDCKCCVIIFYRLIDCLYLCFSLPARCTWLYCYTLICVPHVMWRRVLHFLSIFRLFSFLLFYKRVPNVRISLSFFCPDLFCNSKNDTPIAFRTDSVSSFFNLSRECAVSSADNYTQCIKTACLNDTLRHLSHACAPRLSNCVYEHAKNMCL